MKMNRLVTALTIFSVMGFASCSSKSDIETRIDEINEAKEERIATQTEREQEAREEQIDGAPDWFLAPPDSDATGFFGVGYAQSKSMGHALKSAKLQAEFSLAKMYKQELSGSERAFERGDSDGNVSSQTTFLIDKIVDAVPVVGYSVIEQKMWPINGKFETFVLLKLPYDEFNKVLAAQRAQTLDKTVLASFDDLERRLADRRKQKSEEETARHKREMESLQKRADILEQGKPHEPQAQISEAEDAVPSGQEIGGLFKTR